MLSYYSTQPISTSTWSTFNPHVPSQVTSTQYSPLPSGEPKGQSEDSVLAPLDQLLATFVGTLLARQVSAVYDFLSYDSKCRLLCGPTMGAILEMLTIILYSFQSSRHRLILMTCGQTWWDSINAHTCIGILGSRLLPMANHLLTQVVYGARCLSTFCL